MAVRINKKSWWVDFRFNRIRYRKRSPENSRAGALVYEAVLRQKLARGESIDAGAQAKAQEQTFAQFAWKWFAEYSVANNKPSEQWSKRYILSASLIPFFGKMLIGRITVNDIERYKTHALREGVSRKTVNNRLTVLRTCLSAAYEWLELEGTPPKVTRLKCPPPKTDYLSTDECALLLSHANDVIREMVLTALRTGMRQGELRGLQWTSIDWQNRILVVRHSRCDYTKELGSPKGNRERHIPLDADVYEMLLKRRKNVGYVFLNQSGRPFGSEHLARLLADICKKAGLRKIGWHTLRHTFASHLIMRGAPLASVQMLLGHTAVATTMRYAHLSQSTLRTAIDLLNPKQARNLNFGQPVVNRWLEAQMRETSRETLVPENLLIS
jgi:integrase